MLKFSSLTLRPKSPAERKSSQFKKQRLIISDDDEEEQTEQISKAKTVQLKEKKIQDIYDKKLMSSDHIDKKVQEERLESVNTEKPKR